MKAVLLNNDKNKKEYIDTAFQNDFEIIELYDKDENVTDISEVCTSIFDKCKLIEKESLFYGVESEGEKIGYFVFQGNVLVSFGVSVNWRKSGILVRFFEIIITHIGSGFTILLYSYNKRAIKWLEKMGMEVVAKEITILKI